MPPFDTPTLTVAVSLFGSAGGNALTASNILCVLQAFFSMASITAYLLIQSVPSDAKFVLSADGAFLILSIASASPVVLPCV